MNARYDSNGHPVTRTVVVHCWAENGNDKANLYVRCLRGADYEPICRRYADARMGGLTRFHVVLAGRFSNRAGQPDTMAPISSQLHSLALQA